MKHLIFAVLLRASSVTPLLVAGMADAAGASPAVSDRRAAPHATASWQLALDWRLAMECTALRRGWPLVFRWTPNGRGRGIRLFVDACLPLPPRAAPEKGRRA